jgi:translation initiation factor IF-2
MAKKRVYELAKQLNTSSQRLMDKLAEMGMEVKTHMSQLEDVQLNAILKELGVRNEAAVIDSDEYEKNKPAIKSEEDKPHIIIPRKNLHHSNIGDSGLSDDALSHVIPRNAPDNKIAADKTSVLKNPKRKPPAKPAESKGVTVVRTIKKSNTNEDIEIENKAKAKKTAVARAKEEAETEAANSKANEKPNSPFMNIRIVSKASDVKEEEVEEKQVEEVVTETAETKTKVIKKKTADSVETVETAEEAEIKKKTAIKEETIASPVVEEKTDGEKVAVVESDVKETVSETGAQQVAIPQQIPRPQQVTRTPYQGTRPQQQGTRPQQGTRTPYQGTKPPQQGTRTPYQGAKPPQQGTRTPYQGNRPQQPGTRPPYQGAKPPQQGRPQPGGFNRDGRPQQPGRPQQGGLNRGPRGPQNSDNSTDEGKSSLQEFTGQKDQARKEFQNKKITKPGGKDDLKRDGSRVAGKVRKDFNDAPDHTSFIGEKKSVNEILSEDYILNEFYDNPKRNKKLLGRKVDKRFKHIPHKAVLTSITAGDSITVKELAELLKKTSSEVITKLMKLGVMVSLNESVDFDTAVLIADEYNVNVKKAVIVNEEDILFDDSDDAEENLKERPPVVVVMGHVDHGKTSLLDAIRETKAVAGEAGGITQHIGAYIATINGRDITFLDTPGHEAFTAMRARGAQVTDIAVLVVAADDGIMPQTVEAINHAKAANVKMIVAINKIDKENANVERVKQDLTEHGIVIEDWGGDVICVPVSAKNREGIDELLEMILLTADVLELRSDYDKQAKGTVIEAKLDKGRGALATVLVQRGTLRVGDSIIAGSTSGRIRAMVDDKGNDVKEAGPSVPVEIVGLTEVPSGGDIFYAIKDEKVARNLVDRRKEELRDEQLKDNKIVTLENLFTQMQEGELKELNIIVKADVQGSVEAVSQSLSKIGNEEVKVRVIHGAAGAVNESDVSLAEVSDAIIIGFNVRPGTGVLELAESVGVDLRMYRVIYDAINDIESAIKGMLTPKFREVILGHVEIRQTFKVSGVGTIGGAYVTDGKIERNSSIRIVRDGIVKFDGKLSSLKRFKDDAKEVVEGYECGISIEKYNDIKEGDIIEAYAMEEIKV